MSIVFVDVRCNMNVFAGFALRSSERRGAVVHRECGSLSFTCFKMTSVCNINLFLLGCITASEHAFPRQWFRSKHGKG